MPASPLTLLPPDAPLESALRELERSGAVVIEGFVGPAHGERLRRDLEGALAERPPGSRDPDPDWRAFHGRHTRRVCGLARRSPAFVELLVDPRLRAYADHFLLPHCGSYWLNTAQLIAIGPGESAQHLHRDEANWPHFVWPGFEITVSSMLALGPFRTDNGATRVVPGSHLWREPLRGPTPEEIVAAEMESGSLLLYTGKVIHGGGANVTAGEWRLGLHLSFVLGWLRPEENHYLAVPPAQARGLPPRAQALLGYTSYYPSGYGGRLGLVEFEEAARALTPPGD